MRRTIFLVAVVSLAAVLPVGALDEKATYDDALKYLKSADPMDRAFGLYTLSLVGTKASPASREIIAALADPDAKVRQQAGVAITAANPTLAKPVLAMTNGSDYDKRVQAMQDLSKLGKDASAAVPALASFLAQAKGADKVKVIESLAKVGASDKKLTAQMASWALNSTDPAVRDAALKALPKLADASGQVDVALKALRDSGSAQGRLNAIGVLGSLGSDSRAARQALENLANELSQQVRDAAKKALTPPKAKK